MNALLPVLILQDLLIGETHLSKQLEVTPIVWNGGPAGAATEENQSGFLHLAGNLRVTETLVGISQFHAEKAQPRR